MPVLTRVLFAETVLPLNRNARIRFVAIPLLGALGLYFGGYFGVEHLRHRKGPWEVEFLATNGAPAIRISQPALGLSNVVVVLANEPLAPGFAGSTASFAEPRNTPYAVPHGRVIFEDLTFLPGTVTFDLHGHGIELLPRMLILNRRQVAWRSGEVHTLTAGEKLQPITPAEHKARLKQLRKSGG